MRKRTKRDILYLILCLLFIVLLFWKPPKEHYIAPKADFKTIMLFENDLRVIQDTNTKKYYYVSPHSAIEITSGDMELLEKMECTQWE